jgi:Raf kinase inhibitor-like YbhB/YbcL family protein
METSWSGRAARCAAALLFALTASTSSALAKPKAEKEGAMALSVQSPAFTAMSGMPKKYTCEGSDTSPPLEWSGAPANTKSFVVLVEDPDAPDPAAPQRIWVHWLLYVVPPTVHRLAEGAASSGMQAGIKVGKNDWGKETYGGPCPPKGRHRYFHKVFALDTVLSFPNPPSKHDVESAMKGHVLAQAETVGTYAKEH